MVDRKNGQFEDIAILINLCGPAFEVATSLFNPKLNVEGSLKKLLRKDRQHGRRRALRFGGGRGRFISGRCTIGDMAMASVLSILFVHHL